MHVRTIAAVVVLLLAGIAWGEGPRTTVDFSTLEKAYPKLKAMGDEINTAIDGGNKLKWKLLVKKANGELSSMEGETVKWLLAVIDVTEKEVRLGEPKQDAFRVVGVIEDDRSTIAKPLVLQVGSEIPLTVAAELTLGQRIPIEAKVRRITFRGAYFWIEVTEPKLSK